MNDFKTDLDEESDELRPFDKTEFVQLLKESVFNNKKDFPSLQIPESGISIKFQTMDLLNIYTTKILSEQSGFEKYGSNHLKLSTENNKI